VSERDPAPRDPGAASAPPRRGGWWSDDAFWDEVFEFMFPPEHVAWGEEFARRAAALLGLRPGAAVLDLGCGFGRVSVPLARMGFCVTGVDQHAGFVAHAREWARREGVDATFHEGEMSAVAVERPFDAVLCVFNSFGYFADPALDRRVLETAHAALRPGGRFLLEAAHRDGVVRTMHARERQGVDRHWREEPAFDLVTGVVETRWTVTREGATKTFASRWRPYTVTELGEMLRAAGFAAARFYSDMDGSPPSLDSYMVVALADRPDGPVQPVTG
jgi:SAM-dependent methyltransferase